MAKGGRAMKKGRAFQLVALGCAGVIGVWAFADAPQPDPIKLLEARVRVLEQGRADLVRLLEIAESRLAAVTRSLPQLVEDVNRLKDVLSKATVEPEGVRRPAAAAVSPEGAAALVARQPGKVTVGGVAFKVFGQFGNEVSFRFSIHNGTNREWRNQFPKVRFYDAEGFAVGEAYTDDVRVAPGETKVISDTTIFTREEAQRIARAEVVVDW